MAGILNLSTLLAILFGWLVLPRIVAVVKR
jgi:hypothetical protein